MKKIGLMIILMALVGVWGILEYKLQIDPEINYQKIVEQKQKELRVGRISEFIRYRVSTMPIEYSLIIAQNIVGVSEEYKVPVDLIIGIIEKESIWNAAAISSCGARGLMQILQGENIEVDTEQAHNINYNLSVGSKILLGKIQIVKGDLNLALSNYSGGANDYVNDVLVCMGRWVLFQQNMNIAMN